MKKQAKPRSPRTKVSIVIEKLEKKVGDESAPWTTCSSTGYCSLGI
jgi:hypothetical protein